MRVFYFIFSCVLIAGCNFNKIENELENIDENAIEIISGSDSLECGICKAFNTVYKKYSSTLKEGLEKYKKAGGCCERCFNIDVDFYYESHSTLYSDEILMTLKTIKKNGHPMEYPMCKPFVDTEIGVVNALKTWPATFNSDVLDAIAVAGKRRCANYEPAGGKDTTENSGGGGNITSTPFILDTYKELLDVRVDRLLMDIGGEVEERWEADGLELNLLKICNALNQVEPIDLRREGVTNIRGGLPGGDGFLYLTTFRDLYRYLCSYEEPILLTGVELRGRNGIVIAKKAVNADSDIVKGFGDLCENGFFLSGETTSSMEFYLWEY